jgi:hypothetical protein
MFLNKNILKIGSNMHVKYGPCACGVTTGWSDASSAVVKCRVV